MNMCQFSLAIKFILLLSLFSCGQLVRKPSSLENKKHVVFDIDWTITAEVDSKFEGKRIIEVEGKKYFVYEGIEQLIESLLEDKDMNISFISGGSKERNHSLLKKIKLKNGKNLEQIAYKILNKDDLTKIETAIATDKFSLRYKKDLSKISTNLNNLIMFDDTEHFVLNQAQEDRVFFLGKTFQHFEKFSDSKLATGDYLPRTMDEWTWSQKKWFIIHGAIVEARRESEQKGISFSEAMKLEEGKLDFRIGDWNEYSRSMIRKSHLPSESSRNSCQQILLPFLPAN